MTVTDMRPPVHSTFDEDSVRARRSDPSESHEAADLANVDASIGAVLDTLKQYGRKSDAQLHGLMESLGYPWSAERVRTARKALTDKKLVVKVDRIRNQNNRFVGVFEAVEK